MEILKSILPNFSEIFHYAYLFFGEYYGWVFFVWGIFLLLKLEYLEEIQGQFVTSTEWVFLEVRVPKENTTSTMAVESIFTQMHALHRSLTWEEVWVQGHFQLWYSLEIVSLGGKVSFIIRSPKRYQHLVESAFYSQYPGAEIREVADYMANYKYNAYSDNNDTEFFGTEFKLSENDVIPIKTYKDFEHPSAEEKIIDPLTNVIEVMERLRPHEIMALQIMIQPIQNNEFEGRAKLKIKELIGEDVPHHTSFIGLLMTPFEWFAKFSYKDTLLGGGHGHGHDENKPKNNWLSMTEAEKERVGLVEKKINKACYQTKIRLMYISPKEQYDKIMRFELIGALRHFSPGGGSGTHNTIKSDSAIWTKVDPLFSQQLEGPFLKSETSKRRYWFLKGFKNRSMYVGAKKFLLSVEEIATLFHFPITQEGKAAPAQVQAVESKTSRPPANLPISDF